MWQSGVKCESKVLKVYKTMNYEWNNLMYDFFCQVRSNNIPFTGKMLQEQAIIYHIELRLDHFTATNSWLKVFHGIRLPQLSGEGADVIHSYH